MTANQTQILELFRALSPDEREALLPELAEAAQAPLNFEDLSAEEQAAIQEGIAQMQRGETIPGDVLFDELAREFGFTRS